MSNLLMFYSDQHIREFGSFSPFNKASGGLTLELDNIIKGFRFVADKIRELKPVRVGALGDLYQNTEFQSARVLHASAICLGLIKKSCDEVGAEHDLIPGNHDIFNEQHNITSVSSLTGYANIYLEPFYVDQGGFKIAYIPAISNNGKAYTWLMEAQEVADLICTHMDFAGCRYENGYPSESGLTPDWKVPIIAGDIHLPQDIGSVSYVGSLIQQKFYRLTLDQVGGILTYNMDTKEKIRYANTYSKHYIKVKWDGESVPDKRGWINNLDPERCVLQVVSSRNSETVAESFQAYQHTYVKAIEQRDEVKVSYTHFSLDNPGQLLRSHISKERPEAIEDYDKIIKGN